MIDSPREKMKEAFRQFVLEKTNVIFDSGELDAVFDHIEKGKSGPLEVNFRIRIPEETVASLKHILEDK